MARATRTFRVFVSSTFTDLKAERDALQRYVFPRLRDLCVQHGCRFQAIDLRWGISEEAFREQPMRICLDEIARCQRVTPRPNFIVLLGDRYGARPVPFEIPASEFEGIERQISNPDDRILLHTWYQKDDNAVPPVYGLRPRTGEFTDHARWESEERRLWGILFGAIEALPLTDDSRLKYLASATEQEITKGALTVDDAKEHVFCFFRHIPNIPMDKMARYFIDLDPADSRVDTKAQDLLTDLKRRLREFPGNVIDYEATWRGGGPKEQEPPDPDIERGAAPPPHTTGHITKLCEDVFAALSELIKTEIQKLKDVYSLDKEIKDHAEFLADRVKFFIGRKNVLDRIENYVTNPDRRPLVVCGESGSGKSAVMARAVEKIQATNPRGEWIVRFIGATPSSSDIRSLLEGVCRQISRQYGADEHAIPVEYRQLVDEFSKQLAVATADRPLVLFLDALDQLSDADHGRNLVWLPAELPEHVRLVVSAMQPSEPFTVLERKLPETNRVQLEPMPESEGSLLLDLWLNDARRTLKSAQRAKILEAFRACPFPLYLRLAFEEARRWKSYDAATKLSPSIPGIIRDLFRRLSLPAHHGKLLVTRSLAYLAAARNGLTEDELIDVLSRDRRVLRDFRKRSKRIPGIELLDRLPVVVWSRLYFDLEPYLTERSADNASLLAFYHRQLREVAEEEYLAGAKKKARHSALADYFKSQALLAPEVSTANTEDGPWREDARALAELPFHLASAARHVELERLLAALPYLAARVATGAVYELVEDYRRRDTALPPSVAEWHGFLRKHAHRLAVHPTTLVALANHEDFPDARQQAAAGSWRRPWLRTSPEPLPSGELAPEPRLHARVVNSIAWDYGRPSAIAADSNVAFCFERLGVIRVVDVRIMEETDAVLRIRRGRPLFLSCAPDGTTLAIFFESGEADLYHCVAAADGRPAELDLRASFAYRLPECEDPVAVWHEGTLWFQKQEGTLAHVEANGAPLSEETLPEPDGELSALVFTERSRLIVLRNRADTVLVKQGSPAVYRRGADVASACACDAERVAVAFTDGSLVIYDLAAGLVPSAENRVGIVRGALGWDGARLLCGVDLPNGLVAWQPAEASPLAIDNYHEVLPRQSSPRSWMRRADGSLLLVTALGLVAFRLAGTTSTLPGRLIQLFGGSTWRAVRSLENEHWDYWLLEREPFREIPIGRSVRGRLYCAPDGEGHFFAATGYGPGRVYDLVNLDRSTTLEGCPHRINAATGDAQGGCWFVDGVGDIYFADARGCCTRTAEIELSGVTGARLKCCGQWLVWFGYSAKFFPDTGMEPARTLVFFKRTQVPAVRLERVGEQRLPTREGTCETVCYDSANDRLVTVWRVEGKQGAYRLRLGRVEDFIAWHVRETDIVGLAAGPAQAALSDDGRWLGVITAAGELACVDVDEGQVIAALAASRPFTGIAPAAGGPAFWVVEAETRIYQCGLRTPS